MINSVYGKKMEYLSKRINVRLVNNEKDFLKYTSRAAHITYKIFDKNYAAILEINPVLTLNKPIYVGFTILDLSKLLMYDFHYNSFKNTLTLNCYLLTQTVLLLKFTLFNENVIRHKTNRIQSKNHKIGTCEINKISLSCFENKRFVLDDGFIH